MPCSWGSDIDARSRSRFSTAEGSATASHLLAASTSTRPSSPTSRAIVRSCRSNGCSASSTRITVSAKRIARSASPTESSSSLPSTRGRRRRPAVSTSRIGRPRHIQSTAIASRVMPASGPVSSRSSPMSRLARVDLPTLGRPTMATCNGLSYPAGAASALPASAKGRSLS